MIDYIFCKGNVFFSFLQEIFHLFILQCVDYREKYLTLHLK